MTIHCVSVSRPRKPRRGDGVVPPEGGAGGVGKGALISVTTGCRLAHHRARPASESRVSVAVDEVEHETHEEPPSEALPGQRRETAHHEHTEQCARDAHEMHEGDPEGAWPIRVDVSQHDHADAD